MSECLESRSIIPRGEIVVSVKVYSCKNAKAGPRIQRRLGVNIDKLDDYDNIEMYLHEAQEWGIVDHF